MNTPEISIIFPTYLRPNEVIWNLEYFQKNITVDYEVFILDNSPEPMIYNFQKNENYIFLNENIGTASRNIGIQKANAPYVLLLDDDSHPETGEVERLIELLTDSSEEIAGLICEIHNPDESPHFKGTVRLIEGQKVVNPLRGDAEHSSLL